ncbi:MAG: ATP-sensitive inward rectifier potassium channel 10 [Deltaproteobacteria bacterium]|nr:ATP-sensitive inward rectifier potassium channel 10 [Deltaproteobacteria bacterium]HCH61476.1 ATP-sensitive inward rectifier potassium channel 10 [Deltaproteobacteria bacterium]
MPQKPANPPRSPSRNTDMPVVVHGNGWRRWFDVYHELLRRPWSFTLTVLFIGWLFLNIIFAALYQTGGDCISAEDPESFFQAFTFSVQTISSIGYGAMHPTTNWARLLANIEAFVGMVMMAMGTGLMFAKFSRPTAKVDFSKHVLIQQRYGGPHLVMRVANRRGNRIVGAKIHLAMLVEERTEEGHTLRKLVDLPLVRDHSPTFAITLTIMHSVDADSPLAGQSEAAIRDRIISLVLTIQGLDETFSQTVHAQQYYPSDALVWNHRFTDMVFPRADGVTEIYHQKLHDIEPMPEANHV